MRRPLLLRLLAAALLAVLVLRLPALGTVATSAPAPAAVQGASAISGTAAWQHVENLATHIGPRAAGSAAQDAGAQYVVDTLTALGYSPRYQAFPLVIYDDRGSRVTAAVNGAERAITATTLTQSPAGEVEGPLVDAGLGRPEDFTALGEITRGRVALIRRGGILFREKVAAAAAAGAVGVVVANNERGGVQGSLGQPGALPAATISGLDGDSLLADLERGPVWMRLVVDASMEERQAYNVVATLPGRVGGAAVVVGGHMDSVPVSPGANDNASGVAVMLEVARTMAERRDYDLDLVFVAFGAEELGLHGSRHFVETLSSQERASLAGMINLDMVGVGDTWRFGGTDWLVQSALRAATDLGASARTLTGPLVSASDHAPFLAADVPAVFVHRLNDPNYHTAGDVAAHVDPTALAQAGEITLRLLDDLARTRAASRTAAGG